MTQLQQTNEPQQESKLPSPVERRGIDEFTWRALVSSVFPGAKSESILMAVDYCRARKLDVLKKPVHIVPMQVKDAKTGEYGWRDVIMPGISELRTTAARTGEYVGHSEPAYGPEIEHKGVKAPEWCQVTVYRMINSVRAEFPHREYFKEVVATKKDGAVNSMWTRRPIGQLTKCTIAGGLRDGFPEELGGVHTADEMEGRIIDGGEADVLTSGNQIPEDVKNHVHNAVLYAMETSDPAEMTKAWEGYDADAQVELWHLFNSAQRTRIKKLLEMAKPINIRTTTKLEGEILPVGEDE